MTISRLLWRAFLTVLAVALTGAALIGLWYVEENYRGTKAWSDTRHRLEARGESLDAAHFVPPPVPDDQNLAMAPFFVWLYDYQVDPTTKLLTFKRDHSRASNFMDALPYGSFKDSTVKRPSSPDWTTAKPLDLAGLQRYYRARPDFPHAPTPQAPADDVLLALTRFDKSLHEIAQAAEERPLTRFPVNWSQRPPTGITMAHGGFVQGMNMTLRLRACAELSLGRTDDALRDVLLGLRLSRAISEEPTLISNLVTVTCLSIQLQPIWEGLSARGWSAAQLASLQARLQEVDLLADYRRAVRGERALFTIPILAELRGPEGLGSLARMNAMMNSEENVLSRQEKFYYWAMPSGWSDRAVAITCEFQQKNIIDCVEPAVHKMDVALFKKRMHDTAVLPPWPTNLLARITIPVYSQVAIRNTRAQTAVDEACVACALERYHLEQHDYPAALDRLVPAYLPRVPTDVIDGAPLRYAQTADGRYKLWSVGWNGSDEQGKVVWEDPAKPNRPGEKQGDWVWQYEPLSPP